MRESYRLVERSRSLFGKMHDEDKEEAIDLNAEVETAIARETERRLRGRDNPWRSFCSSWRGSELRRGEPGAL